MWTGIATAVTNWPKAGMTVSGAMTMVARATHKSTRSATATMVIRLVTNVTAARAGKTTAVSNNLPAFAVLS